MSRRGHGATHGTGQGASRPGSGGGILGTRNGAPHPPLPNGNRRGKPTSIQPLRANSSSVYVTLVDEGSAGARGAGAFELVASGCGRTVRARRGNVAVAAGLPQPNLDARPQRQLPASPRDLDRPAHPRQPDRHGVQPPEPKTTGSNPVGRANSSGPFPRRKKGLFLGLSRFFDQGPLHRVPGPIGSVPAPERPFRAPKVSRRVINLEISILTSQYAEI